MKITITAPQKSGKSTVAQLIKEALALYEIDSVIEDEELAPEWCEDNEDRLDMLSAKGLVVNINTFTSLQIPNTIRNPNKFNLLEAGKEFTEDEVQCLANGRRIHCIKKVRERTGWSLMDAKLAVERFQL